MEARQIATVGQEVLRSAELKASNAQRTNRVAIFDPGKLPATFVRAVDRDIADRVVCAWSGIGEDYGSPELRRALTESERSALELRACELRSALERAPDYRAPALCDAIQAMLGAFPVMQRHSASVANVLVASHLEILADKERPHWAIIRACRLVRTGDAGLGPNYCPTEPEFNTVVGRLLEPFQTRLRATQRLLGAKVTPPVYRPAPQSPSGHLAPIKPWQPGPELLADLEARKARNAARD